MADYRDRYRVVEMTPLDVALDIAEGLSHTRIRREVALGPRRVALFVKGSGHCPAGCPFPDPCPVHPAPPRP